MKKIISIVSVITIVAVISFALPNQTYAAWWNPFSWSSKNQQATTSGNTASGIANSQPSDIKTTEYLEIEISALKTSLDNLYKAHDKLVNDHNALLKSVNAAASTGKSVSATTNSSNLETRVAALEKKLNSACGSIFGGLSGCPSIGFGGSLEDRIEKLERAR